MRRLHLVRHAPVVVDFGRPAREWPLAGDAAGPVRTLAGRLAPLGVRRVVSSPEPKAVATAAILADRLGVTVETRDGLEEHHRLVEQQSPDRDVFVANVRRFFAQPDDVVFGAESAGQALQRFERAVAGVMAESDGDEIVVSHGTVMSLLIAAGGDVDVMAIWSSLGLPDHAVLDWPSRRLVREAP